MPKKGPENLVRESLDKTGSVLLLSEELGDGRICQQVSASRVQAVLPASATIFFLSSTTTKPAPVQVLSSELKEVRNWYQSTGIAVVLGRWIFFFNFKGPQSWILKKS